MLNSQFRCDSKLSLIHSVRLAKLHVRIDPELCFAAAVFDMDMRFFPWIAFVGIEEQAKAVNV